MPFVARDGQGNIIGVYNRPQRGRAEERLAPDHPEVLAFRNRPEPPNPLAAQIRSANTINDLKDVMLAFIGETP